MERLLFLFII